MTLDTNNEYLIGLDLGTSTIKAVLMSTEGTITAESKSDNFFIEPQEGYIEISPDEHYQAVCKVIRELCSKLPKGAQVKALSMAAASGNTMLTDQNGKPLTNIISWMDKRAELEELKTLDSFNQYDIHDVVGWPSLKSFPMAAFSWLKEKKNSNFTNASHYCMNTDWLLYKLTNKWVMDNSTATTFFLQDQVKGEYYQPFLDILEIKQSQLSKLVASGVPIGNISKKAAEDTGLTPETIIVSGCFDHPAAARATGVIKPGSLLLSCGTSWVGFSPVTSRKLAIHDKALLDPFLSFSGGAFGAMFSIPCIGKNINWYVDNYISPDKKNKFKIFDELALAAPAGANGLLIDPSVLNKNITAPKQNIARALMEGTARLMKNSISKYIPKASELDSIVMVGGPSKSPVWPQILADICGLEIILANGQNAGAVGAAILAGIGCGIYNDEQDAFNKIKFDYKILMPQKNSFTGAKQCLTQK